jgi:hypothetical protein
MDYPDFDNLPAAHPSWPWTVFEANGRPLGRVLVPAIAEGFVSIERIGVDDVALRWQDPLGFVHLSFHALERVNSR